MQEQIDAAIKILLDRIYSDTSIDKVIGITEAISKLADAKQTLFGIGERKDQKTT